MTETPLSGVTVLVIEDEYLIAIDAQRTIEDAGADHVLLANSVGEVRSLLADAARIDVVVLDLKLGKDDATPLIAEIANRGIPLLVTTGFDSGVPPGVRSLSKPYRDAELIEAIVLLLTRE